MDYRGDIVLELKENKGSNLLFDFEMGFEVSCLFGGFGGLIMFESDSGQCQEVAQTFNWIWIGEFRGYKTFRIYRDWFESSQKLKGR